MTDTPDQPTGVILDDTEDHTHWTWRCACPYRTPWAYRTEEAAQEAYDSHRERCTA